MKNPLTAIFRARDKPRDKLSHAMQFGYGATPAGKTVNPRSAVQISAVYACVRVIAETIASIPFHYYKKDRDGRARISGESLDFILHSEPNPEMTSFSWRETMMTHLLLWGNSYNQIIRDGAGRVVAIYPLLPELMDVDRDPDGSIVYEYAVTPTDKRRLSSEDVLHIPGLGFDGLKGYSPIAVMRNTLGLSLATEEYGASFFKNSATPSGVLTHPGRIKRRDDGTGGPEALRAQWQSVYSGPNRGRVAVLEEGMKFERISMPNNEAQFLETRKFQVSEIARIFRVPPHMIGDLEHATFSNIEHQAISFAQHTIRPWAVRIEQACDRALIDPRLKNERYAQFNLDGLMRGDYASRMSGYAVARQNGWMNANDIRNLENMDPIPEDQGGDIYLVNGNMIPISQAGKETAANG